MTMRVVSSLIWNDIKKYVQKSLYNFLFSLQKDNFVKLIEGAFPACKRIHRITDDVLNFLMSCLNIAPEKRTSIQQLQDHKIFGGKWQYTDDQVNIWKSKSECFFSLLLMQLNNFNEKTKSHR